MVIHDLNVSGARSRPTKADAELIVHTDAMLAGAIPCERFEAVARRDTEVCEPSRDLQLPKLAPGDRLNVHEALDPPAVREPLCVGVLERHNHEVIITLRVINVKHDYLRALPPRQAPGVAVAAER